MRAAWYAGLVRAPCVATGLVALVAAGAPRAAHADRLPERAADRPAAAEPAFYERVATHEPRAEMSRFLVAPAQRAVKANDLARAIPLYQALVVARGAGSPEAKQLAMLWTLAGHHAEAADAWSSYAAAASEAERGPAVIEATRLRSAPSQIADQVWPVQLAAEARKAFARGRAAFAARHYRDALVYFHMGYALAPELPGFLRELGASYDKLGARPERNEFYRRYLVQRPFGGNADAVRTELAREHDLLGTLRVSSSLPCRELWVNRQRVPAKLDAAGKGIAVAPGEYKGLCFDPRFEMALFEYATVEPGKTATLRFQWAIVENQLERPFGRIALENPKSPGTMIDLGITSKEVGVAAPADGRKLKMILKDDSGLRIEERLVQIAPGQRLAVRW